MMITICKMPTVVGLSGDLNEVDFYRGQQGLGYEGWPIKIGLLRPPINIGL